MILISYLDSSAYLVYLERYSFGGGPLIDQAHVTSFTRSMNATRNARIALERTNTFERDYNSHLN